MTNDSVIINFKDKKIEKCLPLKEKSNVIVFAGNHAGKTGQIEKIVSENIKDSSDKDAGLRKGGKMAIIHSKNERINVLIKQIRVTELLRGYK